MTKRLVIAFIAFVGIFTISAGPALASGSYGAQWNPGPIISFTNTTYSTSSSSNSSYPGQTVSTVSFSYSYTSNVTASNFPNLTTKLCDAQRCVVLPKAGAPSNGSYFTSGTTSSFSGDPSVNTWRYEVSLAASSTYALQANSIRSGTLAFTINP